MGDLTWEKKKQNKKLLQLYFASQTKVMQKETQCLEVSNWRSPSPRKELLKKPGHRLWIKEEAESRDLKQNTLWDFPAGLRLHSFCPICTFFLCILGLCSLNWSSAMQVSIACTDHNLKRGNGDHSKSATSPNVVNQARAKFRTVAIIARSFGSFTPRHISLKESTGKHTGMKYRCVCVRVCAGLSDWM